MPNFCQLLINIFFPPVCIECRQRIPAGMLCPSCRKKLQDFRILQPRAYCCPDIESICLFYRYDGGIKKALHEVKFHGEKRLLAAMAEEMAILKTPKLACEMWHLPKNTLVVPIPTDSKRVKERGYDVPHDIFCQWAKRHNLVWAKALARIQPTKPQYGLDRNERRKNVRGCFSSTENVRDKPILVVDDIFTSGATAEEAARVLRQQGARHVWVMAFAGGADDDK